MAKKLTTRNEAVKSKTQHTKPCHDCPWSREAIRGWLGGADIAEWLLTAHSDATVACHTVGNQQCAGIAIYRRNVCKFAYPPNLRLDVDRENVFASPAEFASHHKIGGSRFLAMTGAKSLVNLGNGLQFKLPVRFANSGINHVKVTLNGMDLYDIEFGKVRGTDYAVIETMGDVYADDLQALFTDVTGLDVRM